MRRPLLLTENPCATYYNPYIITILSIYVGIVYPAVVILRCHPISPTKTRHNQTKVSSIPSTTM